MPICFEIRTKNAKSFGNKNVLNFFKQRFQLIFILNENNIIREKKELYKYEKKIHLYENKLSGIFNCNPAT